MNRVLIVLGLAVLFFSCGEEKECCAFPETENFVFETEAQGCANFYVYKELPEQNLHLYVQGDREALDLDLSQKEFSVDNENLKVEIFQFDGAIGNYACDDVANDQGEVVDTWKAIAGLVNIQITEDSISVQPWGTTYKISVELKSIRLENGAKEEANLRDTEFKEVFVGWLPG